MGTARAAGTGLTALGAAALAAALAGCGDDSDPAPGQTPSSPTAAPTGTGGVAECVVGQWRGTGVTGEVGDSLGGASMSGGGGLTLVVEPDGAARLDFTGMEPVSFTGQVAGVDVAGELTYTGQASGPVRTDTGTSGSWEPAGEVDWSEVRLTVDLTEPTQGRPVDGVPVGEALDEADQVTQEVIDVDPVLADGTFRCQDGTLELAPDTGESGLTWTLTRAG